MNDALKHSSACWRLIDQGRFDEALAYCVQQRIEPPPRAVLEQRERTQAASLLGDYGWWAKRLKLRAAREGDGAHAGSQDRSEVGHDN